jgi:hypothetical protein
MDKRVILRRNYILSHNFIDWTPVNILFALMNAQNKPLKELYTTRYKFAFHVLYQH